MFSTRQRLYWLCIILLAFLPLTGKADDMPSSVGYCVQWVHATRVHVVVVDLNDPTIMVAPRLAYNQAGKRQSFIGFMADHHPLAQLTGSYFSLRSALPIGDIVIDGDIRYRGPVGSALALTTENAAQIVNIPYGWKYSWPGFENVLKGGLRLVQNGKYAVFPRDQGFHDPALFRRATRTAVGLTGRHKLLMVAINKPILLSELAIIMKGLGCRDAMTLDGGTSTGMAYGDDIILTPGRTLSNVLMVLPRPEYSSTPAAPPQAVITPVTSPATQGAVQLAPLILPFHRREVLERGEVWSYLPSSLVNPLSFRYSYTLIQSDFEEPPACAMSRRRFWSAPMKLKLGW